MADTTVTSPAGQPTGIADSLSAWAGPYVTEMLGRGRALSETPYQAYTGPLTAGPSELQQKAFRGIGSLQAPTQQQMTYTPTSFTGGIAQQYMNPYLQTALDPQIAQARRQAELQRMQNAGRLAQAGAFGGSRQAVMEAEGDRGLLDRIADITGQGYRTAYDQAQQQFNIEQDRQRAAAKQAEDLGFRTFGTMADMGGTQRGITSEGIAADIGQFREERDDPFKKVQYMQSLLQGMPVAAQQYQYAEPSMLEQIIRGAGGINELFKVFSGK